MTNWIELMEDNRIKIKEAMFEAAKLSYFEFLNTASGYIEVSMNEDSELSTYWIDQNQMEGDIYNNKAISLGRFKVMDDFNFDYSPIFNYLTLDEQKEFVHWCHKWDFPDMDDYIEVWNGNIYERIIREAINDLFEENEEDVLNEIDRKIEDTLISFIKFYE